MSKPNKRRQAKQKARQESLRHKKSTRAPSRNIPLQDPFLAERMYRRVFLELGADGFSHPDRLGQAIDAHMAARTPIDEIAASAVALDPVEQAQELAWQALAWLEAGEIDRASKLGKKALDLDDSCLDAGLLFGRLFLMTHEALDDESYDLMKEASQDGIRRLEAQFGPTLAEEVPEPLSRPIHRTLSFLLDEAPKARRHQDAFEFAIQSMRLGPGASMNARAVWSWLLWGKELAMADALMDGLERANGNDTLAPDSVPVLRWWRSWSAFLAGNVDRAHHLAQLAARDFPDSALLLFADSNEDIGEATSSEHLSQNLDLFSDLLDSIQDHEDFLLAGRTWFGLEAAQ